MELLSVVASLNSIAERVLAVKDQVKDSDKREDTAEWLRGTANLLESVAQDLKNGIYPHSKCVQLNYFSTKLGNILVKNMEEDAARSLRELVRESYHVEKLFGQLQDSLPEVKMLNLVKLDEVAVSFRDTAEYLKVR